MLPGLALDGRSVGVHVALTADRQGVLPPGLAATAKKRLALRLVDDLDLTGVGLGADAFAVDAPPGRGYLDGLEVQVAILGGADVGRQVEHLGELADRIRAAGVGAAPAVERLTDSVDLSTLAPRVSGLPVLGIAGDTLTGIGFDPQGTFLIGGPPQSGRTTALMTVVHSLQRCEPERLFVYAGTHRSPLVGSNGPAWTGTALDIDAVAEAVPQWIRLAQQPDGPAMAAVIENLSGFADSAAEQPLEQLVTAFVAAGHLVVADGETAALTSSWGLPRVMKAGRHGLLLQPDTDDGESVLRTALPRVLRSEFPAGRGVYVRSGRCRTVQVALPS
jgi:DNA segregation ATPase FtsK/SpoIIIE, S-DNA-T family